MNTNSRIKVMMLALFFTIYCMGGCSQENNTPKTTKQLVSGTDLGSTIGSLVEIAELKPIPVQGYGLVGGLKETGSEECPPEIREYLKQYIQTQLPEHTIEVEKFIKSRDTAVVIVDGMISATAWKGQRFDIKVSALPGIQTTSLENGWLYNTELKPIGAFGITIAVIANAEGPIFMDKINGPVKDKRHGYVLGGGKVLHEPKINLTIRKPDYRTASRIRNRLNERFGYNTARAVSSGIIELTVPSKYEEQKLRFISLVEATYLDQLTEINKDRINTFIVKLANSDEKHTSEIALEAIGSESLSKLGILLSSSNEQVRLRAARCMLNLGDDRGLQDLREIVMDNNSSYRIEAMKAITTSAKRGDAAAILRKLLRDHNSGIRLAAYEQLRKLNDISIMQRHVADSFYLEQISQTGEKAIYISRSSEPRIVLFGTPIYCRDNIFVQSTDGSIVIDSRAGQKYVSVLRKHPTRPTVIGPLKSSFELGDIILTLCEEPLKRSEQDHIGLGVSYADAIALIKQMCDKGFIKAEFWAGPLPKIGTFIKK